MVILSLEASADFLVPTGVGRAFLATPVADFLLPALMVHRIYDLVVEIIRNVEWLPNRLAVHNEHLNYCQPLNCLPIIRIELPIKSILWMRPNIFACSKRSLRALNMTRSVDISVNVLLSDVEYKKISTLTICLRCVWKYCSINMSLSPRSFPKS